MLRRYGCFSRTIYVKSIYPLPEDDAFTTEAKWNAWVKQESLKRFVFNSNRRIFKSELLLILSPNSEQPYLPCSPIFVARWRTSSRLIAL
jgi:hypothetical protein